MALNSTDRKKKSKKSTKNCPSAILKAVPTNYQKITFTQLDPNGNFHDKAIIGKICHLNSIGSRANNGHIRKLLVTDGLEEIQEEQKKLTVFLLDQFAEESKTAEVGGYIIIANFSVEKSTHHKNDEQPVQVLVNKEESKVWFGNIAASQTKDKKKSKEKEVKEDIVNGDPIILSNHYEYTPLGELCETESKETYNIYGIVEKCDLRITQGKGTQILDLVLTDESQKEFICSVYSAKDESFPNVYPGEIIRIHRMLVYKFRSKLKGKCLSSKFILVFNKNNEGTKPRTTAKSFTYTAVDASRVKNLFEWYEKRNQPKLISEIQRGDFVNIICQVIGVYIAKHCDAVYLKIWDGTKTNQIDSRHLGLRDEKLDEKLFSVAKNYYVVLSVYGHHCATAAELKPGQFIEVLDAHLYSVKDNPDDSKLSLHAGNKDKRGIQVLGLDDSRLLDLKERFEKIIADVQEFENQTEDILSADNSIFLNCDISVTASSQKSNKVTEESGSGLVSTSNEKSIVNAEESANIDALNKPMLPRDGIVPENQEKNVISVVEAAVKTGQCTQEFGGGLQKEYEQIEQTQEMELSSSILPTPVWNKTPFEFRMFLHNPTSQTDTDHLPPFTNDTPDDWWQSLPTISVTEGHSDIKPSTLAEVMKHEVPYKFRTFCAVLSYKPNTCCIPQLIRLYCPNCMFMTEDFRPSLEPFQEHDGLFYFYCPECSKQSNQPDVPVLKYIYIMSFDLHDGTGPAVLEAYVWGENAVKLLKGVTPEQVLRNIAMADLVLQMLWSICPNSRPFNTNGVINNNSYPVLDCCIMSYTTSEGETFYQLFDTKLL